MSKNVKSDIKALLLERRWFMISLRLCPDLLRDDYLDCAKDDSTTPALT